MQVKLRVYLDTSVLSAMFDARMPERRLQTQDFWDRRSEFELGTSQVCVREIGRVKSQDLREKLIASLPELTVLELNNEIQVLAHAYVSSGAFSSAMVDDALHVATAVYYRYDVLLSWNYRHLVNRRRRAAVLAVNAANGYPSIDIVAPPEL